MFRNRCNDIDTVLLLQSCQVVRIFRISYLSRHVLYYYIMAENQTCLLCVVHCAVYACLQHDCLRVGLKCKRGIELCRYVCTNYIVVL